MKTPMLERLRRSAARLLAFLMVLAACQAYAQRAADTAAMRQAGSRRFLLWKVASPTATVYLLGSVHVATPEFYPLPDAMESAFAASKVLAVEVNVKETDPTSVLGLAQEKGIYGESDSLSQHISKQTSDTLDNFCNKSGMPREMFEHLKPWLVAMTVTVFAVEQSGESHELGIDKHFMNEVRPTQRIDELESADYQMAVLSSGSDDEQQELLASTLKQAENAKESLQKMNEAYLAGDASKIEQMLEEESGPKSFYKRLVEDRNVNMAAHVEDYLKGREQCFVVVGAGHLVGSKGIVKLLEGKGYHVERMTP